MRSGVTRSLPERKQGLPEQGLGTTDATFERCALPEELLYSGAVKRAVGVRSNFALGSTVIANNV